MDVQYACRENPDTREWDRDEFRGRGQGGTHQGGFPPKRDTAKCLVCGGCSGYVSGSGGGK